MLSHMARGDFPGDESEMLLKIDEAWVNELNKAGLKGTFRRLQAKVEDHHARVTSAFADLERRGLSVPLVVDDRFGVDGPADYSLAPGGLDGHGDGAVARPDAALAMSAMGDDASEWASSGDFEFWRRTYKWPAGKPVDGVGPAAEVKPEPLKWRQRRLGEDQ